MSKRVALLLTGTSERKGLPAAFAKAFDGSVEVLFVAYGEPDSFTSARVDAATLAQHPIEDRKGPVEKMASALVGAALDRRQHFDLVIAIDDLELINQGRSEDVRAFFRAAVQRELARIRATIHDRERIAERCSFHLLAPMLEALFFGEADAIARATTNAGVSGVVDWSRCPGDLEEFETADAAYLDPPNAAGEGKEVTWRKEDRHLHPKRYLQFLCREGPSGYKETKAGVAALRALDLASVLSSGAPLFAALLGDLEDALGTRIFDCPPPERGVLRNL